MLIYGAIIIPVLVSIYLFWFHRNRTVWWEYLIIFGVCIPVVFGAKYLSEKALIDDVEYWGSIVTKAVHDEPWDEYVYMICTRTVSCGKDCTTIETYDCSYVDNHPRYCRLITTIGEKIKITHAEYVKYVQKWGGKEIFTDMKRNYHSYDGDRYHVNWDKQYDTVVPVTSRHTWENRVQAASDVFNFPDVSPEDVKKYGLYDYPPLIGYTMPTILGYKNDKAAQRKFMYLNGHYGPSKRIRLWVLLFRNKTPDAGEYQEMLWKKGNKNEFVVCIGIDNDENITWVHPFTWAEQSKLVIETRDFVLQQKKLNLLELADWMEPNVILPFKKKDFREFNYLRVNPSGRAVAISYIIVLIVNIGVALWVVFNGIDEGDDWMPRKLKRRRYR